MKSKIFLFLLVFLSSCSHNDKNNINFESKNKQQVIFSFNALDFWKKIKVNEAKVFYKRENLELKDKQNGLKFLGIDEEIITNLFLINSMYLSEKIDVMKKKKIIGNCENLSDKQAKLIKFRCEKTADSEFVVITKTLYQQWLKSRLLFHKTCIKKLKQMFIKNFIAVEYKLSGFFMELQLKKALGPSLRFVDKSCGKYGYCSWKIEFVCPVKDKKKFEKLLSELEFKNLQISYF